MPEYTVCNENPDYLQGILLYSEPQRTYRYPDVSSQLVLIKKLLIIFSSKVKAIILSLWIF